METRGTEGTLYVCGLNRLARAQTVGSDVAPYDRSYAYNPIGNMLNKTGTGSYGYGDAAHKHAVTHLDGVQRYWYDANGNMTTRVEGGVTYQQTLAPLERRFIENRLVSVCGPAGKPPPLFTTATATASR